MEQTDGMSEPDCDLYVKYNSIPSRTDFDWRDISTNGIVTHNITNAPAGRQYIGIYAFRPCNFRLQATLGDSCPGNCNGHGTCNSLGKCVCTGAWTGEDCNTRIPTIAMDSTYRGSVASSKWTYVSVSLPHSYSALTFTLTQDDHSSQTDLDLYVRRGGVPSLMQFDYANGSMHYTSMVSVSDAAPGDWFVGVWGYSCKTSTCGFSLAVSNTDRCPNRCSMRGFCRGTVCSCQAGYTGEYCETQTAPMTLGTAYHGYVESFAWNYYTMRASTSNTVRLNAVHNLLADGDCDLYVRKDQRPTIFAYDYKDNSLSTNSTVDIDTPGDHVWHIGMYGYRRCDYRITAALINDAGNCQHGGRPNPQGSCICPPGYGGDLCQYTVLNLPLTGQPPTGVVRSGEFVYYNVSLPETPSDFIVYVKETRENSVGEVWVYLSQEFIPTIREHAFSDIDTNTAYHMIHVTRDKLPQRRAGPQNFIIGVYGSPYIIGATTTSSYQITAWASPFQ